MAAEKTAKTPVRTAGITKTRYKTPSSGGRTTITTSTESKKCHNFKRLKCKIWRAKVPPVGLNVPCYKLWNILTN